MQGQSQLSNASVTRSDTGTVETYTGSTVNFKERHGTHMRSVTNLNLKTTTLSSYLRSLNRSNTPYTITWGAKEHTAPYNPIAGWCRLCTLEKHHILFDPVNASLNQRSEFFCYCFHKKSHLLVKWRAFMYSFWNFNFFLFGSHQHSMYINLICNCSPCHRVLKSGKLSSG